MSEAIKQAKTESNVKTIAKRLIDTPKTQTMPGQPLLCSHKGYRNAMVPASGLSIKVSTHGLRFTAKQTTLHSFFECNPTPACVVDTSGNDKVEQVQVASTTMVPPHVQVKQEFYKMMVKMMQKVARPPTKPEDHSRVR
jgi:hypothetical protein